jgi:Ion channel
VAREPETPPGERTLGMGRRPDERWAEFAERLANAFGLVLLLVLATYVLQSLIPYRGWTGVITTTSAAAAAIVAFASCGVRPSVFRLAVLLGAAAIVLAGLSAITDGLHLLAASALVQMLLLLVATGAILRTVLAETEVGFRTILGAVSVYTILGLLFTFLYAALDRLQDGEFFGKGVEVDGGDILFFSFTTLTTTGYGNLVPAGQPGRMFSGLEMLMGQVFLVTLVAGLVSLWRPGSIFRRGSGD